MTDALVLKNILHMARTSDHIPQIGAPLIQSAPATAEVLVVCEHASNFIPDHYGDLGLTAAQKASHIAWDPGAMGVAQALAERLNAPLIAGGQSRLVYDLNRPTDAKSAIPERSEIHEIPGNHGLSRTERQNRIAQVHAPFYAALVETLTERRAHLKLIVTLHSFTPVFKGERRAVELGILHGKDTDFARAMLAQTPSTFPFNVQLNQPYSAADGVAHTLDEHGHKNALLNVMLEIRNDLIATDAQQAEWGALLAPWLTRTLQEVRS